MAESQELSLERCSGLIENERRFPLGDNRVALDDVLARRVHFVVKIFSFYDLFYLHLLRKVWLGSVLCDTHVFIGRDLEKQSLGWVPTAAFCCCLTFPKESLGVEEWVSVSDVGEGGAIEN